MAAWFVHQGVVPLHQLLDLGAKIHQAIGAVVQLGDPAGKGSLVDLRMQAGHGPSGGGEGGLEHKEDRQMGPFQEVVGMGKVHDGFLVQDR
ncbi:MAG TPA: hypothetical protein VF879_00490 [Nitrospirales bacterium]